MYNVLILEDEKEQRQGIESIIRSSYPNWCIFSVASYSEAVSLLSCHTYHLFLLDIALTNCQNSLTGMDFGMLLRNIPLYHYTPIIYLTALADQIIPAVQNLHCFSYLTKPYSAKQLLDTLAYLLRLKAPKEKEILFQNGNGIYFKVEPYRITYIESQNKTILIHTTEKCIMLTNISLQSVMQKLPEQFFQIHRCFIVNMRRIVSYSKTLLRIKIDTQTIPVGRTCKKSFEKLFFGTRKD